MKNPVFSKTALALVLALLPFMAHAEANYDGLFAFLLGAVIVIIILFFVSLVAAIQHYRKGGQVSLYLSLAISIILYVSFGLFAGTGYVYELSYLVLIPLTPVAVLCARHLKTRSVNIMPYVGMNLAMVQLFATVLRLLPEMAGGRAQTGWVVYRIFSILTLSLMAWLLTKAIWKRNPRTTHKAYYTKATLLAIVAFGLDLAFSLVTLIRYDGIRSGYIFNIRHLTVGLLPDLVAANLVAWLFLRYYAGKEMEDRAGPPL
ncbi:MAG: hypothetical protein EOP49_21900 [Sphingobacteriales bacterium]|nr:MAG: hypothetical protein EOP49_21900 [Sphingobacteriales bacterium]